MNWANKYILSTLWVTALALGACSKIENESGDEEQVYLIPTQFSAGADTAMEDGDLIGVSLNSSYNPCKPPYYSDFAHYKVVNGKLELDNDEEIKLYRSNYKVMFSGVKADAGYTTMPDPVQTTDKLCYVYDIHRTGFNDEGDEDPYLDATTINNFGVYGTFFNWSYTAGGSDNYNKTFNVEISLKKQYSKMKVTLQSNKAAESGSHIITEVKLDNLIHKAQICPLHGLHLDPETDMESEPVYLVYDDGDLTDDKMNVSEIKTLKRKEDITEEYIEILSGNYTKLDASGLPVLPSPMLSVTYGAGAGGKVITNYLPIMIDLKPQTYYKFDVTLTSTQINVKISKIGEWNDGGVVDQAITPITSYSIDVESPSDWEPGAEDGPITGTID